MGGWAGALLPLRPNQLSFLARALGASCDRRHRYQALLHSSIPSRLPPPVSACPRSMVDDLFGPRFDLFVLCPNGRRNTVCRVPLPSARHVLTVFPEALWPCGLAVLVLPCALRGGLGLHLPRRFYPKHVLGRCVLWNSVGVWVCVGV
jgi:hypothetical protein